MLLLTIWHSAGRLSASDIGSSVLKVTKSLLMMEGSIAGGVYGWRGLRMEGSMDGGVYCWRGHCC
jgi:hypothetical protein